MKVKFSIICSLLVCALMAFPSISSATPVLKLFSGGQTVTIEGSPGSGVVSYNGPVDKYISNIITGVSDPYFGLFLVSENTTFSQGNDWEGQYLRIQLSDTGFSNDDIELIHASLVGTQPWRAQIGYSLYWGTELFEENNLIAHYYREPMDIYYEENIPAPQGTYSLTLDIWMSHRNSEDTTTTNFSATATPEPSSLILLGSGLLGTCLFFRRRTR
jgi:hypothetical protein